MTDDSLMTADPGRSTADVTALRRWLQEQDDEIKRLRAAEKMMVEQFLDQEREATAQAKEIERLRRWLREHEDNAKRLHAEIEALRRLVRRGIEWPSMSMDQSLWIREVKEWLEPHDVLDA